MYVHNHSLKFMFLMNPKSCVLSYRKAKYIEIRMDFVEEEAEKIS